MPDTHGRTEPVARFKQSRPEVGVYRIVNARSGKALLGLSLNLPSVRNKIDFTAPAPRRGGRRYRIVREGQRDDVFLLHFGSTSNYSMPNR